jgi:SAM-dependent MidA family methyltransferase
LLQDFSLDKIQDQRSENDQKCLQNITILLGNELCEAFPIHCL